MSDSMLIFTIGPVQGFIKEARRTHDLWAGSQILVGLIRSAAKAARASGAHIIYPSDLDQPCLPNRFVAQIDATVDPEVVASAAEKAVQAQWEEYTQSARERLLSRVQVDDNWKVMWDRQVSRHLEVFWSVCPQTTGGYGEWYQRASAALGARKHTRDFVQSEESGPKDSLSGVRSALWVPKPAYDETDDSPVKAYWKCVAKAFESENPTLLRPDGRERLDAVGATKRFTRVFPESAKFPSVSSVAAADFRRQVKTHNAQTQLDYHANALKTLGVFQPGDALYCSALAPWDFDGDTLYLETLTPKALEDDYHLASMDPVKLYKAHGTLQALYSAIGTRPNTYYAVLVMDGDRMGKRVGLCQSKEEHRILSDSLARFAAQATHIVENDYAGRVVYAGGDDLLALLPLADALPAARKIRNAFASTVKDATISAGIVLAHHRAPLDAILDAAREAEETAKHDYGRDALCVIALKRSGEHIRVGAKWAFDSAQIISDVAAAFQGQPSPLASKLAFDVDAESRALADMTELREAYSARIKWLVSRHSQTLTPAQAASMAERIIQMAEQLDSLSRSSADSDRPARGPVEMARWLLIARFLAQGGEV